MIAPATALNAGTVLSGSGLVTLAAANGNIVLDDPTTDFHTSAGVVFNGKNVTLSPLGRTPIILGAANNTAVAENLTVTSATGSILNGGNVTASGDAFFQTGNGNITLTQAGNRFGTVRSRATKFGSRRPTISTSSPARRPGPRRVRFGIVYRDHESRWDRDVRQHGQLHGCKLDYVAETPYRLLARLP